MDMILARPCLCRPCIELTLPPVGRWKSNSWSLCVEQSNGWARSRVEITENEHSTNQNRWCCPSILSKKTYKPVINMGQSGNSALRGCSAIKRDTLGWEVGGGGSAMWRRENLTGGTHSFKIFHLKTKICSNYLNHKAAREGLFLGYDWLSANLRNPAI